MLKQLYLITFEMGLVTFAGAPSHFGIVLYPALGKQTLLSINVTSLHLTPIGDLNRQRSSFNLHSFCICISSSSSSSKKETFHCKKWPLLLLLLQALTPQKNDSTSSISESSNTNNAPSPSPEMVPFPPPLPFLIFPLPS